MVQRNKKTSIHYYNEWKNHKVELRSSSSLTCAKTVFFSSSPACLSLLFFLKFAKKMFIYQPHELQHQRNKIRTGSGFLAESSHAAASSIPRGRLPAGGRLQASRRAPATSLEWELIFAPNLLIFIHEFPRLIPYTPMALFSWNST